MPKYCHGPPAGAAVFMDSASRGMASAKKMLEDSSSP
jgi:hypothetical protein